MREHRRVKRSIERKNFQFQSRLQQKQLSTNFWKFAKSLLQPKCEEVEPTFNERSAFQYFKSAYQSQSNSSLEFERPSWLSPQPEPSVPLLIPPFTIDKINEKIKRGRSQSSPSPVDQISYKILKGCPSLVPALVHLYNRCLDTCSVPKMWKIAVIKLITKPGKSVSHDPSTFRPIALTSVIGKVFTSVLKDHLFHYLISNNFLSTEVQKGFVNRVNGCQEHQFKLMEAIRDAKSHQRSQTVLWLDLRNAFGTVDHRLIQFALSHYHCGDTMSSLIADLYNGLGAVVSTKDWCTPVFNYGTGVLQGDPLSVAIFDMVINLYADAVKPLEVHCAYFFSKSANQMLLSSFADDMCIVSRGIKEAKILCERTDQFLSWSGLDINASKCACFSRARKPGLPVFDPHLCLQDKKIPFLSTDSSYKYLGLPVSPDLSCDVIKDNLLTSLSDLLACVDRTAISRFSKCLLYKKAIIPRLSWLLSIASLPISWIESKLDSLATKFLKKWVGLAHSAATSRLFLSSRNCGLDLPQPSVSFKNLQTSRLLRFTRSKDTCLRALAKTKVEKDCAMQSSRFTPGRYLRKLEVDQESCFKDSSISDKLLKLEVRHIKKSISLEHENHHIEHLHALPVQGKCLSWSDVDTIEWSNLIRQLPDEQFKFIMNAIQNTLPTRTNLHLWKKSSSHLCPLCNQPQSLCHVLNACPVLLQSGAYKRRHDKLLALIASFVRSHTPNDVNMIVDLPGEDYIFPISVATSSLRPDVVIWKESSREAWLLELSVVFESVCDDTKMRKELRYNDLLRMANQKYRTKLLHLLIGSRGMVFNETRRSLAQICKPNCVDLSHLLETCMKDVIESSYYCWIRRNGNSME